MLESKVNGVERKNNGCINRIRLMDLRNSIVMYVKKYEMYPCSGQIIDYINLKFKEFIQEKEIQ